MNNGQWYLGFSYRFESENYVSQSRIVLDADNEEEATTAAVSMWKTLGVPNPQGPSVMYVKDFTVQQTKRHGKGSR
jgi:hypothetical protein